MSASLVAKDATYPSKNNFGEMPKMECPDEAQVAQIKPVAADPL